MNSDVTVPARAAMKYITMNVRVTGTRALNWRIWIGSRLIKVAAAIIGCGVSIETVHYK